MGAIFCSGRIHPCLPRMAHIPRGSELSLMISSLHAGGHRKSLGYELGVLHSQCGCGMGSSDLEQVAFTSLDLPGSPGEGAVCEIRGA